MRGRHQHEPGVGGALHARGNVEALGIAEHRNRHGAGGQQRPAAGDVAGVFHPGGIARIEQQLRGNAQRLLRAGGDDDVRGVGQQAACRGEMGGDLAP